MDMANKDILRIKWNFHNISVLSMMQGFRKEDNENLTDVTMVSDDMLLKYQVHKFVLSAVSPVFKEILLNNPHDHPLIYLTGVNELSQPIELKFVLVTL